MSGMLPDIRTSVAGMVDVALPRLAERARIVEQLGFDHFWLPDERLFRNIYASLTVVAGSTSRIGIGTAVTNPYTRHPVITASAIATVDELSGGRTTLGVGAGGALDPYGIDRTSPVSRIRDTVDVVRSLTRGESLSLERSWMSLKSAHLDFQPIRQVPVYIAARGAQILKLAGEIADGVIIGGFAEPAGIAYAKSLVKQGLDRAERTWNDIETVAWIFISISRDAEAARAAVSRMVLAALISSRPIHDQLGIDLPAKLRTILKESEWAYPSDPSIAERYLPAETIRAFAVHGTPHDCVERLAEIRSTGVDQMAFLIMPPEGSTIDDVIATLAAEVIPQLAAG